MVVQIEEWTLSSTSGSWFIDAFGRPFWNDDSSQSTIWDTMFGNSYEWTWGTWVNSLTYPVLNINWLGTVHITLNNAPYMGRLYKKPSPWTLSFNANASRADVETLIMQELGIPQLKPLHIGILDQGCVGVTRIMHRRKVYNTRHEESERYPITQYPEDASVSIFGEVKAFLTEADMNRWTPTTPGIVQVCYVKVGPWRNGNPPVPDPYSGEVPLNSVVNERDETDATPSETTVNNFITKVGTKWVQVSRGIRRERGEGPEMQQFEISDTLPPISMGMIYIKRMMPAHQY